MSQPTTYVTQDMLDRRGVPGDRMVSPPVAASDIRKWAIAVYWPETPPPLFWDEEYAKSTRWGGIIAPQDFNPFAWPVHRPPPVGLSPSSIQTGQPGQPGTRGMNGGTSATFGVPIRPGDVITSVASLAGWDEREGRLGLTLYIYNETRWTNQRDEHVKTVVRTGIRY